MFAMKSIQDNQFKLFQHHIIHRILGNQDLLFKMKITDNPRCRLCNTANETIEHLFLTCEISKELWSKIFAWIMTNTRIQLGHDNFTIIFGYNIRNNYQTPINTILIIAKQYIFICASQSQLPTMQIFLKKLQNTFQEQKLLAITNHTLEKFNKTW